MVSLSESHLSHLVGLSIGLHLLESSLLSNIFLLLFEHVNSSLVSGSFRFIKLHAQNSELTCLDGERIFFIVVT